MYNNPYAYNSQMNIDRLNEQINSLEKMKAQMQQPVQQPSINQTFQLAPNSHTMRYANTIDDVSKETVYFDTPFFSKDMSVLWVKGVNGVIKSYELKEIVKKDEKDIQIELLQAQIEELRKEMKNNVSNVTDVDATENKADTEWDDSATREAAKSTQPPSVQRVSTSKKRQ
jgi:uncharacterized protein YnzC (UPF0291/DUF896 family)